MLGFGFDPGPLDPANAIVHEFEMDVDRFDRSFVLARDRLGHEGLSDLFDSGFGGNLLVLGRGNRSSGVRSLAGIARFAALEQVPLNVRPDVGCGDEIEFSPKLVQLLLTLLVED